MHSTHSASLYCSYCLILSSNTLFFSLLVGESAPWVTRSNNSYKGDLNLVNCSDFDRKNNIWQNILDKHWTVNGVCLKRLILKLDSQLGRNIISINTVFYCGNSVLIAKFVFLYFVIKMWEASWVHLSE